MNKNEEKVEELLQNENLASEKKIEELENIVKELQEKNLWLTSTITNSKREFNDKINDSLSYNKRKILSKLVDLAANFQLAFKSLENTDDSENFKGFFSGFLMIKDSLKSIIEGEGVEEYIPQLHHEWDRLRSVVVEQQESEEEAGIVLEVISSGYTLDGKVLLHAKVKVSKRKSNS